VAEEVVIDGPNLTSADAGLDCPTVERKHILVVEDELPTLALLEKILVAAHYRVTGARDGMAALKAAHTDTPDLVLLDLIIPGVDGYGVCALLKRDRTFHAPVVVLSGRASEKDIKAAYDAGADAFLAKPIDRQALLTKISELLAAQPPPETKEPA
jgi:DNA-binding response OmpR family regulator